MTYGERLQAAMNHAGINQPELSRLTKVSQQNISRLIRGKSNGSIYTVRFANACGVRHEWLADESGEMINGIYIENEKIKRGVVLMQELPEYLLDDAIASIASIKKLAQTIEAKNQKQ